MRGEKKTLQVHNIPIGYRNKSVAEDICEAIGQVDRTTSVSDSKGGSYIRVRVTMDVYQPLYQGRIVTFEEGGKIWVNFRYERLPNLCYQCGCLDHGDRDCDIQIQSKGTLKTEEQQFGSWIRATQLGPTKNSDVRVSGFYENKAENMSTQRRREMKSSSEAKSIPKSKAGFQTNKETTDMEADSVEPQTTKSHKLTFANIIPIPVVQDHGNKGGEFAQQLKEIDRELGIYREGSC